jgi:hypothetical protein
MNQENKRKGCWQGQKFTSTHICGILMNLTGDGVASNSVCCFRGDNGQPQFLSDHGGKKAANGMRLPAGGFLQLIDRGSARAAQKAKDGLGLAAIARCRGFCGTG